MGKPDDRAPEPQLSFEEALARLKEINDRFEAGDLPLKEAIDLCREGAELANFCQKQLEEAEQVVKKVLEEAGEISEEEFEPEGQ